MKKLLSVILTFAMCFGFSTSAMATEVDIVETTDMQSIYSPEFPNAYIIQNESTEQSKSAANTQTVSATVFLEEEYSFDDNGNPITISSRLLSESEVHEVGLENFRDMEESRRDAVSKLMQTRVATNARGSLTITFSGTYSLNGRNVTCDLNGNASWNTSNDLFWQLNGEDNPNTGTDYMGVVWSGGFTCSSSSINAEFGMSALTELPLLVMCDSVPNAGRVWEFYEFWQVPMMGSYAPTHITNIDLNVTLSKSNMGNDKAEAVLKYIHTYESTKGSISITANSSGVGGGFVLNNVSKQWSIVCTVTGIPC